MFFDDSKQFSLPEIEKKVLEFWRTNKIFEKSLALRKAPDLRQRLRRALPGKQKTFVFYEGPPSANGSPGLHHVLARIFKDVVCRYRAMQGYFVPRKSGWDTHGLPVEITVEKQLGFKSKKEIEQYGIAKFNAKCREVVWQYKNDWEKLTERIGFWLDLEHPYITYENDYIESLWWIIKQIAEKKLLYQGHKVVPWCPRCGTGLSSHEIAQGYKEVTDQSVYLKFKLKPGQKIGSKFITDDKTYILSWTTTPWTLPGNVALAVGKNISYGIYRNKTNVRRGMSDGGELILTEGNYILANDLLGILTKEGNYLTGESVLIKGKDLISIEYEPLFDIPRLQSKASYKVYGADFVTTTDGTGVVHTAVMYGEDDYKLGLEVGLPQHHTVGEDGKFLKEIPVVGGLFVKAKETEEKIFKYLEAKSYKLKVEPYTHEYPFCWRCETPLIYYARTSWFVAMSKLKDKLLKENEKINWTPAYLKEGRFGEWLREAKDWNFSRERYWGTPLPIWVCAKCGEQEAIGSREELGKRAMKRNNFFFLRHGQADHNLTDMAGPPRDDPARTSHLTPQGREAVARSAKILAGKKIDLIVSSPLARAKETAAIVEKATGAPVEYRKELVDIDPGIFIDRKVEEAHAYFKNNLEKFVKPLPEGESHNDVKRRVAQCFKSLNEQYERKNILIISHGDPLWLLKGVLEGLSNEETLTAAYPETGNVYEINWQPLPLDDAGNLDFHRPYVDEVKIRCRKCKGIATRVKEVVDVWFDSGAMPFAQSHYPFEGKKLIDKKEFYPADYISEAVDQTRGWFYTLLAVAVLLGKERPYKNVISLGHVNDKFGRKMSKSKGNVVDPWQMAEKYGIDAVRWYFYTATPPGEPKSFDEAEIVKSYRKFHLILYNSLMFYRTYADQRGTHADLRRKSAHVLDRWILARLEETIDGVTQNFEKYDIRGAALTLENLVDDLSRWYIRRSRRRLQPARRSLGEGGKPQDKTDYDAASGTLGFVLQETAKLIAPFTPFFAEMLYESVKGQASRSKNGLSVHLTDWPLQRGSGQAIDKELIMAMEEVRRLASVALAKRAEAGVKVRQPLKALRIKNLEFRIHKIEELLEILKDEVNVKEVVIDPKIKEEVELDTVITPELQEEGMLRELTRAIQGLRQDAGLKPKDKIILMAELPKKVLAVVSKHEDFLKNEVNAKEIQLKKSTKFDAELEMKFEEGAGWLGIRRVKA